MRYLVAAALVLTACGAGTASPVASPSPVETVTVTATPEPRASVTIVEREVQRTPAPEPEAAPQHTEPAYVSPDPATVSQFIKGVFRERLDRDPDQGEMQWHLDWYMAEDREGGDTRSRWLEMFDREYESEIQMRRDQAENQERQRRREECERDYYDRHGEPPPGYMCGV